MDYCTIITNREKELEVLNFLSKLSNTEISNKMCIQFKFIMGQNQNSDYHISFNRHNLNLFVIGGLSLLYPKEVNLTEFLANIEKTINALNLEKLMRKLTLENYKTLTEDKTVIVYQNNNSDFLVKPLMMMVTQQPEVYNPNSILYYSFMNMANPLIPFREFQSGDKMETIRAAIESGNDVYVAESITKIIFSGENGEQPVAKKIKDSLKENYSGSIGQIESYIYYLLRKHSKYLVSELGLNQYPKETYEKTTETFITEKLK